MCASVGRGVDEAGRRGFRVRHADAMRSSLGEGLGSRFGGVGLG